MEIATKVCPVYVHLHNGIIKNFFRVSFHSDSSIVDNSVS